MVIMEQLSLYDVTIYHSKTFKYAITINVDDDDGDDAM